jgi:DNA repair protein SbcD/Mre11
MKKALAVIATDLHLKQDNISLIKDLIEQQCKLAEKLGVKYIFLLGDIFDSRISQRLDVLLAFKEILDIIEYYNLQITIIPGNHDKTDYSSDNSFLDPFVGHKSLLLLDSIREERFGNFYVTTVPYYTEDKLLEIFSGLRPRNDRHFIFTHIGLTGSVNNDGTKVTNKLTASLFKDFYKVFSGHYHDEQQVGKNFFHLPSICQNNFGENEDKGFTVLYDDGSHELVKSIFPKYIKVKVDLDKTTKSELDKIVADNLPLIEQNFVRLEFFGDEAKIKSLDKDKYVSLGFNVKNKMKEIEEEDIEFTEEISIHTDDSIIEEFKVFCQEKELNYEQGVLYLHKKLKNEIGTQK